MIGYGQREFDKKYYDLGMSKAEAEMNLRHSLRITLDDLRVYVKTNYPDHPFDTLSRKSQEMLLDLAFSEGPAHLSDSLCVAVITEDWNTLFNHYLYIRWIEQGWPYTIANKAFADRWLDPATRQIPSVDTLSIILNKGYREP